MRPSRKPRTSGKRSRWCAIMRGPDAVNAVSLDEPAGRRRRHRRADGAAGAGRRASRSGCANWPVPRDEIRALAATLSSAGARAVGALRPARPARSLHRGPRDAANPARNAARARRRPTWRSDAASAGGPMPLTPGTSTSTSRTPTAWRSSASPAAGASASTSSTKRRQLNVDGIARKFMSPDEQAALRANSRRRRGGARCCGCGRARKR